MNSSIGFEPSGVKSGVPAAKHCPPVMPPRIPAPIEAIVWLVLPPHDPIQPPAIDPMSLPKATLQVAIGHDTPAARKPAANAVPATMPTAPPPATPATLQAAVEAVAKLESIFDGLNK